MIEKLIELLDSFSTPVILGDVKLMDWKIPTEHIRDDLVAHLIANGVRLNTKQATSDKTSDYPITNGDKIRAMSDKELAGFLAGKFTDFTTQRKMELGEIRTATAISEEAHLWRTVWMQWLRMPVEDV